MSLSNKGLGRGLNALFNPLPVEEQAADSPLSTLATDMLEPNPDQPRSNFSQESLAALADSIRSQGILQPLLVRQLPSGAYQIIAGERRWRAAKMAGLAEVPVIVRELDDSGVMLVALIENLQREDLNPLERSVALNKLKDMLQLSQEELADKVGMPRGTISNLLRLVNLDPEAQEALLQNRITLGHARCILTLPEGEIASIVLKRILDKDLTVRDTELLISFWRKENRFPWESAKPMDNLVPPKHPEIERLAQEIGSVLHCDTRIRGNVNKGRISIAYDSNEQLFELLEKFGLSLDNSGL